MKEMSLVQAIKLNEVVAFATIARKLANQILKGEFEGKYGEKYKANNFDEVMTWEHQEILENHISLIEEMARLKCDYYSISVYKNLMEEIGDLLDDYYYSLNWEDVTGE